MDSTLEYAIDAEEFPYVASNAVVLVDAAVQVPCPPSAAASPNPLSAVRITGIFEALIGAGDIIPVFEAPQGLPPLLPPPLYANLAPQVRRCPPLSLIVPC